MMLPALVLAPVGLGLAFLLGAPPRFGRYAAAVVAALGAVTVALGGGVWADPALRLDALAAPFVLVMAVVPWFWIGARASSWAAVFFAQAAGLVVVLADDRVLFFGGWEAALIPVLVLLGRAGTADGAERAARVVLGSGALVLATLGAWSAHAPAGWVLGLFVAAVAVKVPLVPVHGWIGKVAAEARTDGLVLLFAWKLGGYALLRWAGRIGPVDPDGLGLLGLLGAFGALIGGALALAQSDLRRLLAAGALVHGSVVLLAWSSGDAGARHGAVLLLTDAAISGAAAAFAAGLLVEHAGTTDAASLGGIATRAPRLAGLVLAALVLGLGVPGTLSFAGEWAVWVGLVQARPGSAWVALAGVVLLVAATARWIAAALGGPVARDTIGIIGEPSAIDRARVGVAVVVSVVLAAWGA